MKTIVISSVSRLLTASLVLGLGTLAACSDSGIAGAIKTTDAKNDTNGLGFGDTGSEDTGPAASDAGSDSMDAGSTDAPEVDAPGKLEFKSMADDFGALCKPDTCSYKMNQNGLRKLEVRYTRGGKPVENVAIKFDVPPPNSVGDVASGSAYTDADGIATGNAKSGAAQGTFTVNVTAPSDPAAGTLHFVIKVESKIGSPLTITITYKGSKAVPNVQALLFKQKADGTPKCAAINPLAPPKVSLTSPPIKLNKTWAPDPTFLSDLQAGQKLGVAIMGVGSKTPDSAALTAGCKEATVSLGTATEVIVEMSDVPPRLKGTYEVTAHFDLLSILPDKVEMVLKTIFNVVKDPVAGILGLTCQLGGSTLSSFCGYVFTDGDPSKGEGPIGSIVIKFLDGILYAYLPPGVKQGLATAADLGDILTNLELTGTVELKKEADAKGLIAAADTEEIWDGLTYKWSLGAPCDPLDPNCGKHPLYLSEFQQEAVIGQFDLQRDAKAATLTVSMHSLNIKWGSLVNYLVQKVLLPMLTKDPNDPNAPVVDSYGALIKSLLAGKDCLVADSCCADFGKQLAGKQTLINEDFIQTTCETLITLGSAYLENMLNGLDAQTGDPAAGKGLLIGSNGGCAYFDDNQDQLVDTWGKASTPCAWKMTITFGSNGSPQTIDATLFAKRQ